MDSIVLIGMMGSGKSTVGGILARELGLKSVDMDTMIEGMQGHSISSIFSQYGERYFRQLETELLEKLLKADHYMIATGGGIVLNPINVLALRPIPCVFYLKASESTLEERLTNERDQRPLLAHYSVPALMMVRDPLYKRVAKWTISVDQKSPEEVAKEIMGIYHKALQSNEASDRI